MDLNEQDLKIIQRELNLEPKEIYEFYNKGNVFLNPKKFEEVFLKNLEKVIKDVWDKESDLYVLNIGREGSGKSLFSIWFAYNLAKSFNKDFDLSNIALTHEEWVYLQDKLEQNFLVHDEAIDTFSALNFTSSQGRDALEIAIRNRASGIINILNIPPLKYVNPYIRDERMDFVIVNLTLNLTEGKRAYFKFLFDKIEASKMVDYITKNANLDKARLIGNFPRKKYWRYAFGGIFFYKKDKDKDFDYLLKVYKIKKNVIKNFVNSKTLVNSALRNHAFYLLKKYEGQFSYLLGLLFNLYYEYLHYVLKHKEFFEYQISLKPKVHLGLDTIADKYLPEKNPPKLNNEIKAVYIYSRLLEHFFDFNYLSRLIKPLIKERKFRIVKYPLFKKKFIGLFHVFDIDVFMDLANNNFLNQDVLFDSLNYIDRYLITRMYLIVNGKSDFLDPNDIIYFYAKDENLKLIENFYNSLIHDLKEVIKELKTANLIKETNFENYNHEEYKRFRTLLERFVNERLLLKNTRLIKFLVDNFVAP